MKTSLSLRFALLAAAAGYYGSRDVTGIAVDAAGDVYVSGLSEVSGSQATWTIRKGVGGASFSTVDVVVAGFPYAIFPHPTAGILVVGTKGGAWVVRRSADGGATGSDVDTFQLSKGNLSPAAALGIGADARGIHPLGCSDQSTRRRAHLRTTHAQACTPKDSRRRW